MGTSEAGIPLRSAPAGHSIVEHPRTPAFTVVVPAFNAAATLRSCMTSVLAQTVADLELIVVDDGSTDETRRIAVGVEDQRVRLIHQPNRGLPAARNAGIAVAQGEITCFLDSDDLLLPRYLETVRRTYAADPSADFVYTDAWTFDDRTRRVRRTTTTHYLHPPTSAPATASELFRELVRRNFIIVPVAVRTSVIVSEGMFDEAMTAAEDWEMWLRLSGTGHRAAEAAGPLGLRRQHPAQMSSDLPRMIDNHIFMFEKILEQYRLSAEERRLVERKLERVQKEREIVLGHDRVRSVVRRNRYRLGRLRRRLGLGPGWYSTPPPSVAAAFPDLREI